MNAATQGWVDRAEEDFASATDLLAASRPHHANVCYLAQQCAEKYLKALLQEHAIPFPRTHNLANLATLCAPLLPALAAHHADLAALSTRAVDARYPGVTVIRAEAETDLATATVVRSLLRVALGLPKETP